MKGGVKLFIYGSLKKGFSNSSLLNDAQFISGNVKTKKRYCMFPSNGYSFPYLFEDISEDFHLEGEQIEGELYLVDDVTLQQLDIFEGVDKQHYYRKTEQILMSGGEIVSAEIYITNKSGLKDGADILPSSLKKWTKEYEKFGIKTAAYIKSNRGR